MKHHTPNRAEAWEVERRSLNVLIAPLGERVCAVCLRRLPVGEFSTEHTERCQQCHTVIMLPIQRHPNQSRKRKLRLTKPERCALNKQLLPQGKRVCKTCSDKPQALLNFACTVTNGKVYYASSCLTCTAAAKAQRYQTDEAYRERHRTEVRRYHANHRAQENERLRQYRQQHRSASA